MVAFGVLPALFVYTVCPKIPLSFMAASAYLLCALVRLAYFNVLEEDRQDHTDQKRTEYLGLPVTVSALILPAAYAVQSRTPATHLCALILASMALLFIFPIRIPKPRLKGIIGMAAAGTALLLGMVLEV